MTTSHLSGQITRTPRIFDSSRAADAAPLIDGFDPAVAALIQGAVSAAPYLMGLLEREAEWLRGAVEDPDTAVDAVIAGAAKLAASDLADGLRRGKRRVALMAALADLGGAWSLEQVTGALTDYADAACGAALRGGLAAQIRRGKMPGLTEDDLPDAGGMVVLAMGKMGAHELNYSSDIDLICLFDETRFDPDDFHDARTGFVRATRAMSGTLNDLTAEGYVFRTDLRLRPDPAVTPVCMAMEAAERYYESLGRTWERAAYIKARPAAGDLAAGDRFLKALRPFVWRRHLDFAAIQDAHDMRLAIREHKGLGGPITLPGHNMKLGRGGIREIEFFTQTRQLIAGGRDPDLRLRGTCESLSVLADKGWVPPDVAQVLADHYRYHRTVEHRVQMVRDAQTHNLPQSPEGFARLAAMMDKDVPELEADLHERLSAVHELTEGFFAASRAPAPDAAKEAAADHVFDHQVLDRWQSYPALRSERGLEIFERLKPDLLARLARAAKPDEALLAFDGFLAGLPAGVQLFSLLKANPQLADLLIDIVSTSPALAVHLSRNAGVFDAVIGGDFFSDWPGQGALTEMLAETLAAEPDYEAQLDGTRRWAREWHFRIGVHLLRGLSDAATAGRQYAELARAVLTALWPVVTAQFALRHGPPPGRGAVLLGMGSLGAGRLTATSDLDMLVIYDPDGQDSSEGKRPLASRLYYARLTQAMITAMTAPMAQGRLYEVDMRLRPSGNQGPVATSLSSFESYQKDEAWVWEHLALTRADVVAGPAALSADVAALCAAILRSGRPGDHVLSEVAQMRTRIKAAKAPDGPFDAKIGAGRLQDIELFAQAGALMQGRAAHDIADGLGAAEASKVITADQRAVLQQAYDQCWTLQCAGRLLSAHPVQTDKLGQAGEKFLARTLGCDTFADLETQMTQTYAHAAEMIDAALPAPPTNQANEAT
ncbi:bifunctional [glutamate--ammonia ligase]-adenylyl-L-tyrosine phosphorylase/[glutamate--ammonia-ligase] adenylyltransferase [Sulfitobacter mediterraneus]|uniref:bifunctional [glutamate--ammonia ligase]-adenylyl-L-tyrosine phosphorylase/[glutamate--ammonia-ligase] adenylyltransferase n=1 Tax=Sulfitobacter mediterraneus TaxID=83219 RepID=UPI0021A82F23|nr:bifunctional [glutamate--ammonia ligase]-adenylyl-L-tyrosine phosphorylase/[glutamate--ammonia-ligase] adenylyltransferase [Sulfitobacter mediterraneus]UWR09799.1 bifunctional [glutamate--ammonia ligase]-adenylyl-L-tyrosine phosphorylase/[glutamate--ammonia-ligase] adenylyltransferase [Sulfitobacter mediterraneus]